MFINAYRKLGTLKRWDNFIGWLYRITINQCKMLIRSQSRRPDHEFIEDQSQGVVECFTKNLYREDEMYEAVQEALNSLPEIFRQVVVLRYFGGMTVEEMSRFLGVSSNTIDRRLKEARDKLKGEMTTMISTAYEQHGLHVSFTFRILEILKRVRINPILRTGGLPLGLGLAGGILLVIFISGPFVKFPNFVSPPATSVLPSDMKMLQAEKISLYTLTNSDLREISSSQKGKINEFTENPKPQEQLMVASGEEGTQSKSGTGIIRGQVTDTDYPEMHILKGATIAVKNEMLLAAEGGIKTVKADENGNYIFDNLPPGEYFVITSKPGYEDMVERVTVIAGAEAFHDVRMSLKLEGKPPSGKEFVTTISPETRIWQGSLDTDGKLLRVVFKISGRHPLTATMDSLDQNLRDIPVDEVTFDGESLHIEIKSMDVVFHGKVIGEGLVVEGEWKQDKMTIPLVLNRISSKPTEPPRLQEPLKPYPYKEDEVVYKNKKAGIIIGGTLTYPDSEGSFPVVILVSNFGAHDRDERMPAGVRGHRLFKVIADYLTRQGIAVLRTDNRGVGWSTGILAQSTLYDFASDVLASIEYLKSRKEIDASRICLVGNGTGSSTALITANQSQDVKSVVMMSGMGITIAELTELSRKLRGKAPNQSDEDFAKDGEILKRIFALLKEENDDKVAQQKLRDIITDVTVKYSKKEFSKEEIDAIRLSGGAGYSHLLKPLYRSFMLHDPRQDLMKIKCPVLVINGEKSQQNPNKENLKAISDSLKNGGNKDYTIMEMSGLNDQLQTAPTDDYSQIEETISPVALKVISNWVLEHFESKQ